MPELREPPALRGFEVRIGADDGQCGVLEVPGDRTRQLTWLGPGNDAAGTIGTGPASVGKPTPRTDSQVMTPSAAARPNAEPPARQMAWMRSTRDPGRSRSVSRVPGAAPRTSTPAIAPSVASTTVQPVIAVSSVAWPTHNPRTSRRVNWSSMPVDASRRAQAT